MAEHAVLRQRGVPDRHAAEVDERAALLHELHDGVDGVSRIRLAERVDDGVHAAVREAAARLAGRAGDGGGAGRQRGEERLGDRGGRLGVVGHARGVDDVPRLLLGTCHLERRGEQPGAADVRRVGGPAELRDPDRLLRVAVLRHDVAQLVDLRVHAPFRGRGVRVGVDAEDVEVLRAAELVDLLDEAERHAGRAAEGDAHARLDGLHGLVGRLEDGEVVRGVRILPEAGDVLLVPDLDHRHLHAEMGDRRADVVAEVVQVRVGRIRPLGDAVEDRQHGDAARGRVVHGLVELREVPRAALRALALVPVEVAAYVAEAGERHHVVRLDARAELVARHVRAHAVGIRLRSRAKRGKRGQDGKCGFHNTPFDEGTPFSRGSADTAWRSARAKLLKKPSHTWCASSP